jgi:hypothetical protein
MLVCISEHVQWGWTLNGRLALGYRRRGPGVQEPAERRVRVETEHVGLHGRHEPVVAGRGVGRSGISELEVPPRRATKG